MRFAPVGSGLACAMVMPQPRGYATAHELAERRRTVVDTVSAAWLENTVIDAEPYTAGASPWFEGTVIDAEPYIIGRLTVLPPRASAIFRGEARDQLHAYLGSIVTDALGHVELAAAKIRAHLAPHVRPIWRRVRRKARSYPRAAMLVVVVLLNIVNPLTMMSPPLESADSIDLSAKAVDLDLIAIAPAAVAPTPTTVTSPTDETPARERRFEHARPAAADGGHARNAPTRRRVR